MRRALRATRPAGGEVATCDDHLADSMRQVTSPVDGHDNDTHLVVRRLGDMAEVRCAVSRPSHPAAWVLIPQAVLR